MHTNSVPTLSPSFSVIAERFRRAGQPAQAVALCREGLAVYPEHLSARVTLGCSLLELGQDSDAQRELQAVLRRAPDNLAAIRGLAELHARGVEELTDDVTDLNDALARTAGELAPVLDVDAPPLEPALHAVVAEQPVMFEIEDVIDAAEDGPSLDFDFEFLDVDDHAAPGAAQSASPTSTPANVPGPVPVPAVSEGTAAVLDEWLSRVRARKAELLSQYAAG